MKFGRKLGEALNFSFRKDDIRGFISRKFFAHVQPEPECKDSDLNIILEHLSEVGEFHYQSQQQSLCLVIDDFEKLPKDTIQSLLYWAKGQADSRRFCCVFLSSDSTVLTHLTGEARAKFPLLLDVSQDLAKKYLHLACKTRKIIISEEEVNRIYNVVGGNPLLLTNAVDSVISQRKVETTILFLEDTAFIRFKQANLVIKEIQDQEFTIGWKILLFLLDKDPLSEEQLSFEIKVVCNKSLGHLLKHNILFCNARTQKVHYHDQLVLYFLKKYYKENQNVIRQLMDKEKQEEKGS